MGNLCQCPEDMHQDREIKADKYRKYDHKDSFADESDYLVTKSKSQFETNSIFRYKVNKPRNIIYNEFIVCTNNQFSMNGKCGTSMNGEHSHTTSVDCNISLI